MPKERGVQTSRQVFYGFAIALFVYGWLSVNIYLPVLPKLESVFDTTTASAKLTVTIFLFGFSFAQLIWGPLSDRVGRKPVLLAGLAVSVIGAMIAAFATNIYVLSASRLLESLGLGAAPVLGRSVLTDTQDRTHVAIAMAYAAIVVATVPAVAPIFGGYLNLLLS